MYTLGIHRANKYYSLTSLRQFRLEALEVREVSRGQVVQLHTGAEHLGQIVDKLHICIGWV